MKTDIEYAAMVAGLTGLGLVQDRAMLLQKHIEQLRAMLPEGD
jgi:hypothetical protein